MLKLMINPTPMSLYCSIALPHELFTKLILNSDNRGGQGAQTNTTKINLTPQQKARLVDIVQNASDGQFIFGNFEQGKDGESGFWSEVKRYNETHKEPITEDTIIEAIKRLGVQNYKQSKIAKASYKPTMYDGGVFHEWKLPLSYVFKEDTQKYDKQQIAHNSKKPDLIYLKLFFTDDSYDAKKNRYTLPSGNGPIHVASFHRDSDSVQFSGASWSQDATNPKEKEKNRKAGKAGLEDARERRAKKWKEVESAAAKKAQDEIAARKEAEKKTTETENN